MNPSDPRRLERISVASLFDLRSGGWVFWLAAAMCLTLVVWRGGVILSQLDHRAIGDGKTLESYGYDLNNLLVQRETLVAAGYVKDGVPAMDHPEALSRSAADHFHRWLRKEHHHKFIVDTDLVIGVEIGGEARAYPTRILAWHQVVNDTLAGRPILVTYDPLCDSSAVFERRVAAQSPTFGVSGLLFNSNLVFYDRRPRHEGESLWCQLQFGAIAGPASGKKLDLLPFVVLPWGRWTQLHPETTVVKLDLRRLPVYKQTFAEYYGGDELKFPVAPTPPRSEQAWKTPMLAIRDADRWRSILLPQALERSGSGGRSFLDLPDRRLEIHVSSHRNCVWAEPTDDQPLISVPAFWFAWYSQHAADSGDASSRSAAARNSDAR